MQRRVALAAAIVHNPDLLFADEPTANLDPILRSRLWEYFRTRAHDGGTLLVTTQYIDEAEYCDRVGLMYDGALIAQGRPEELRRRAFGGDIVEVVLASADLPDTASLAALTGVHTIEVPRDQPMRATVANAEEAIPARCPRRDRGAGPLGSAAPPHLRRGLYPPDRATSWCGGRSHGDKR
jgi:ABC-2 type transport system ATP-binding protein